ncbi:hypothetical protein [Henriciella litoralis]|uniref:hypothetical protein n=1 Tax=Henriciella litoralis TaxID=568102 RepID=UPI00111C428D|nr:hypothetical protein [Henriciella litoralis]
MDSIAEKFIVGAKRNRFNGIVASKLLEVEETPDELKKVLEELIRANKASAIFACSSPNMHIKRFPEMPIGKQIELLTDQALDAFCLYPTANEVRKRTNVEAWSDRPFSKELLLGEPQLGYRAFDMGVLERYVSDPRYDIVFKDYMGQMSIKNDAYGDKKHPERDKVSLQTFGLGFDNHGVPHTIAFLRYLADLSPDHQKYWQSYSASGDVRMCKQYYQTSIANEWWRNRSIRYAITEELRLIRELSNAIWGKSLFRDQSGKYVPIGLTSFLRPTAENFNRLVLSLDKLLSESIEYSFFEGSCAMETESERPDGKIRAQRKASLTLLEEWLLKEIEWDDPDTFKKVVIQPLRKIRRLRQRPAHEFTRDDFSNKYYDERKKLLTDTLISLANIRAMFASHPKARNVKIPEWLNESCIDVF